MTSPATPRLADLSIHAWIAENKIVNEKGDPIEFTDHLFLFDIYRDESSNIAVMKPAQVGLSTLQVLKNHFDAKRQKLDIIYTLPTDGDVNKFVSGKVNRIVANNPCMLADVDDKDSIQQKQIGQSYEYFVGTWTPRAAIMVTADRITHDEIDSSKLSVIPDFQARLQHSKRKQTHVFSHPSVRNKGVHAYFMQSDQKEWFITCPHCKREQYLEWNTENPKRMSIDLARRVFVCKRCGGELARRDRAVGRWLPRKGTEDAKFSGYHISLLMAPWVEAGEIVDKWLEVTEGKQTPDFFHSKVLGLPYEGGGNAASEDDILGAISREGNSSSGRLVVGVDSGIALRYVIGNKEGLIGYGQMKAFMPTGANGLRLEETIEYFLVKFPDLIMVIDQGGDITAPRELRQKYPGRVILCAYNRDRKTMQIIRWGEGEENGRVFVDRNRMIQVTLEELRKRAWRLYNGDKGAWWDYWLHWSHIYRVWEEDENGMPRYRWLRDGRDDWVHATVYWRVGIDRFGTTGAILGTTPEITPNSYMIGPSGTDVSFSPEEMFKSGVIAQDDDDDYDWRDT